MYLKFIGDFFLAFLPYFNIDRSYFGKFLIIDSWALLIRIEIGCKYCFGNVICMLFYKISNSGEYRIFMNVVASIQVLAQPTSHILNFVAFCCVYVGLDGRTKGVQPQNCHVPAGSAVEDEFNMITM